MKKQRGRLERLTEEALERSRSRGPSRAERILGGAETPSKGPSSPSTPPAAHGGPIAGVSARADVQDLTPGANKTERAFGEELEDARRKGIVARWWWQPFSLRLGPDLHYRPDFLAQFPDGTLVLFETKGFMRDAARAKLRIAARMYPFEIRLVKRARTGGAWTITTFAA